MSDNRKLLPLRRDERGVSMVRTLIEFAIIIAAALLLAFLIKTFVAQPYEIPSGSMEDTIQIGDRVLSEKVSYYFESPKRGDIITFNDPTGEDRVLIKRVIATAGQTVDLRDGYVYVNGKKLDNESYTDGKPSYDLGSGIKYPYTVPDGDVWAMGDNRTNSSDSRYFGPVPISSITGHAFWRYWPLNSFGALN